MCRHEPDLVVCQLGNLLLECLDELEVPNSERMTLGVQHMGTAESSAQASNLVSWYSLELLHLGLEHIRRNVVVGQPSGIDEAQEASSRLAPDERIDWRK